jgi:NAD(P)-dependent dehydrogenase (short-subunit alcohol dehydrogenase family)
MSRRFEKKCAVVTGSASGIGKGCAMRLASEGANIIIADVDPIASKATADEIAALGVSAVAVTCDVSNLESIDSMVTSTIDRFGGIDILVNCAGVVKNRPFLEVSEEEWDRIIDINQKGTTFCTQIVAKTMISRIPDDEKDYSGTCYGKIVNFSSISGRRGRELHVHYAASKAAIISITQSSALALAPYGINVNAVSPSVVMTKMWEQNDKEKAEILGLKPGEASKGFIERIPLHRAGTAKDMAGAVAFLCSEDANYITGQTLNVDGGFEMN